MKKTLVGLAAAAAMCGASAASVTLYGVVDTGFAFNTYDWDGYSDQSDGSSFVMASGQSSGSRFGFKGVEELGSGLTVGFVLESGFSSDTGAMNPDGLFNREASLYLEGRFGKFGMGRLATLANDGGSTGLAYYVSSFGTGIGDVGMQNYLQAYRPGYMDNMVYYKTPEFAGTELWVLYGMGEDAEKTYENESSRDRYYAAAVTYNNAGLSLYGAVEVLNKATFGTLNTHDTEDDQVAVTAAVNYDCGHAKSYLSVHWFDNAKAVGSVSVGDGLSRMHNDQSTQGFGDANGWAVMIGANVPVGDGMFLATAGYLDASADQKKADGSTTAHDLKRWLVGAGYIYNLSKRTWIYATAGYLDDSYERAGSADKELSWVTANVGLRHTF